MNTNIDNKSKLESVANYLEVSDTNVFIDGQPKLLANQLVDEVFTSINQDETYQVKLSSSDCPSVKSVPKDDDDLDPRLKCFQKMLNDRMALQQRIQEHTGKRAEDVLFNRHATIDQQTKKMLIRLMDTAMRQDGIPPTAEKGLLKRREDPANCREIGELFATDPKLLPLEIVGVPEVCQFELADTPCRTESKWERSKVLHERLEEQHIDIERILEFCPHIECLQVAPEHKQPYEKSKREDEDFLYVVSAPTSEELPIEHLEDGEEVFTDDAVKTEKSAVTSEKLITTNVIKINGRLYGFGDASVCMSGDLQLFFQCDPHQRMRKTIVQLHNIGGKFIEFKWIRVNLGQYDLWQQATSSSFVFDSQPFILLPGEQHRIDVMYQPIKVGIKKERWALAMQRTPFCGLRRLNVCLFGVCTVPACYLERLDKEIDFVIHKRKVQVTEKLANLHASLVPMIETSLLECPYERALNEHELFSIQNPGFKSERYADLETLKELHQLVKKPRHPQWDYRIETIRQCIYQHQADQREALQNILVEIIEPMRCSSDEMFAKIEISPQRERSCFVYVRGIVCSSLEEWELLAEGLEMQFFKTELQRSLNSLNELGQRVSKNGSQLNILITKKVRSSKYFRDALYIQTYTVLCDAAENIVSAIESTVHH